MAKYKLSVIIPVYNAQDTINRAVDSVINQTIGFQNIELVLYDDNSTDDTRSILKEYDEKYDNIVLILSDENSGYPGKGRNESIRIASADYIMFMDNDDEYCPNMCETLYNEIVQENADIVSSNYLNIDKISSEIVYNNIWGSKIYKNNKRIFLGNEIYDFHDITIWSKIYRKSVISQNNVEFPEDKLAEDVYFIYSLLLYVNKIVYLKDYVGYVRHVNEDSLSKTMDSIKIKQIINVLFKLYSLYNDSNHNIDFSYLSSDHISFCIQGIYSSNILDNKNKVHDLLDYIYKFEKDTNLNDSYLSFIFKIPNKLIMKKQFGLSIAYFKIMKFLLKHNFLRRIYRKID